MGICACVPDDFQSDTQVQLVSEESQSPLTTPLLSESPKVINEKSTVIIQEVKNLLNEYWTVQNADDYFDSEFIADCLEWDDDEQCSEIMDGIEYIVSIISMLREHQEILEFSESIDFEFPTFTASSHLSEEANDIVQFMCLLHYLCKHRRVPSNRILQQSFVQSIMSWRHIASSLRHELGPAIGDAMDSAIQILQSEDSERSGEDFVVFLLLLQGKQSLIAKQMSQSNSDWSETDALSAFETFFDRLIMTMQQKKKMTNNEVLLIRQSVQRAQQYASSKDDVLIPSLVFVRVMQTICAILTF